VASYSPERFLALSESIDLHRVEPERITVPATLVALEGDAVVPPWQVRALADRLAGPVSLHTIASACGHDAFLTETQAVSAILAPSIDPETRA
jgi:homoserine O-acetyltransferase/O-succinyltransferase